MSDNSSARPGTRPDDRLSFFDDDHEVAPEPRRRWPFVVGGVLLLLVVAYAAAYAYAGDRVPRGTTVDGVAIGGLTIAAAEDKLAEELVPQADRPLRLTAGDDTVELVPSEAGLTVDVEATVAAAGGGSADPVRLLRAIFAGSSVEPVRNVDDEALAAALAGVAEEVDRAPRDGAVGFEKGEVVVTKAQVGRSVEQEAAVDVVEEAWTGGSDDVVALPVRSTAPKVDAADVERAVEQVAQPAMSGPVQVRADGRSATLGPIQLSTVLTMKPGPDGALTLQADPTALTKAAADEIAELTDPARDAGIRIEGGRPVVVPAADGSGISVKALAAALPEALTATGAQRRIELEAVVRKPELTTAEARRLGVREVVGEFTTYYPYAEYRNVNIGRAARLIDNTLLEPGEVFSLNGTVGERTRANGFTTGFIIDGGRLREDLGGGVSQVATTTFNAMYFAGLKDVEHKPHSFYISRYPEGREATVAWGALDLRFQNDTPYGVVVDTEFSPADAGGRGTLTVRMWSTKHWTVTSKTSERYNYRQPDTIVDGKAGCVDQAGSPGFDVDVTRTIFLKGEKVRSETFKTAYRAEDRITCR